MSFQTINYNYNLPDGLIATTPTEPRDHCRLMFVDKEKKQISHNHFYDLLQILGQNDVLVLNQSKVFPARLLGQKNTGGQVELLLYHQIDSYTWESISRPGLKEGTKLFFSHDLKGEVIYRNSKTGQIKIKFNLSTKDFFDVLDKIGQTPIPPYISTLASEKILRDQYQTVYAKTVGSAAAPTAGLHFTQNLLDQLKSKGVQIEYITLHVGLGTFKPLTPENLESGKLHQEFYEIDTDTANRLNAAKISGKRIIAVGTTSARTLESAVDNEKNLRSGTNSTEIFIKPPYNFKFVDGLITNFHLPESSLLMLVTAFAGCSQFPDSIICQAYNQAIEKQYRFFSFGDAMFIK